MQSSNINTTTTRTAEPEASLPSEQEKLIHKIQFLTTQAEVEVMIRNTLNAQLPAPDQLYCAAVCFLRIGLIEEAIFILKIVETVRPGAIPRDGYGSKQLEGHLDALLRHSKKDYFNHQREAYRKQYALRVDIVSKLSKDFNNKVFQSILETLQTEQDMVSKSKRASQVSELMKLPNDSFLDIVKKICNMEMTFKPQYCRDLLTYLNHITQVRLHSYFANPNLWLPLYLVPKKEEKTEQLAVSVPKKEEKVELPPIIAASTSAATTTMTASIKVPETKPSETQIPAPPTETTSQPKAKKTNKAKPPTVKQIRDFVLHLSPPTPILVTPPAQSTAVLKKDQATHTEQKQEINTTEDKQTKTTKQSSPSKKIPKTKKPSKIRQHQKPKEQQASEVSSNQPPLPINTSAPIPQPEEVVSPVVIIEATPIPRCSNNDLETPYHNRKPQQKAPLTKEEKKVDEAVSVSTAAPNNTLSVNEDKPLQVLSESDSKRTTPERKTVRILENPLRQNRQASDATPLTSSVITSTSTTSESSHSRLKLTLFSAPQTNHTNTPEYTILKRGTPLPATPLSPHTLSVNLQQLLLPRIETANIERILSFIRHIAETDPTGHTHVKMCGSFVSTARRLHAAPEKKDIPCNQSDFDLIVACHDSKIEERVIKAFSTWAQTLLIEIRTEIINHDTFYHVKCRLPGFRKHFDMQITVQKPHYRPNPNPIIETAEHLLLSSSGELCFSTDPHQAALKPCIDEIHQTKLYSLDYAAFREWYNVVDFLPRFMKYHLSQLQAGVMPNAEVNKCFFPEKGSSGWLMDYFSVHFAYVSRNEFFARMPRKLFSEMQRFYEEKYFNEPHARAIVDSFIYAILERYCGLPIERISHDCFDRFQKDFLEHLLEDRSVEEAIIKTCIKTFQAKREVVLELLSINDHPRITSSSSSYGSWNGHRIFDGDMTTTTTTLPSSPNMHRSA